MSLNMVYLDDYSTCARKLCIILLFQGVYDICQLDTIV